MSFTAVFAEFRRELEQTWVQILPASCHIPLPGKKEKAGFVGNSKQTPGASWASTSSEETAFGQTPLNQQCLDPISSDSLAN